MIVIGEGFIDLYLDLEMVKLGGVFHYSHVLECLNIKSKVYHVTPAYMHRHIKKLSYDYVDFVDIGTISNSPNIITISESKEIGNQRYKNVLDDLKVIRINENEIVEILNNSDDNLFILPGSYNINLFRKVIKKFKGRLFIDLAYDINIETLKELNCKFHIIFISTSSELFQNQFAGDINKLKNTIIPNFADILILKENRGGSRIFTQKKTFYIPAYLLNITHSVGVGDCYNIALLSMLNDYDISLAGKYANKVASLYAQSKTLDEFKYQIENLTKDDYLIEGVSLPWEKRQNYSIYIAAPDFKDADTAIIDDICKKLKYHNFKPIRPIKISGEINSKTPRRDILSIIRKDIKLIKEANLIVAIMLYKDEGTIAEIGYAVALNKPVIIYDPFKLINNSFVECIAKKITYNSESLINSIFYLFNTLEN